MKTDVNTTITSFQVQILRQDGSSFYERTLTKDDFREYTDNQYGKDGALIGFMFDRAEGNKLYFGASVGSPDPKSDEYVPLDVTIDNMSRMRISKATQLDTPSDQPQQQPKSELEKAEEEGGVKNLPRPLQRRGVLIG